MTSICMFYLFANIIVLENVNDSKVEDYIRDLAITTSTSCLVIQSSLAHSLSCGRHVHSQPD